MTIVRMRVEAVVLIALMLMPLAAYSDDAADVLAAEDRGIAALNANDVDGVAAVVAENFIMWAVNLPTVLERDVFIQNLRQGNTNNASSQFVLFGDRQVRINGRTAVTLGTWGNFWKPVDGPAESTAFNSVSTWVKIGRDWKLASWMSRTVPHGSSP